MTKNKIGIVYHCFLNGDWKNIVNEQLLKLKQSGLYDAADIIWATVNLNNETEDTFKTVISEYTKINVEFYIENHHEYPGIKKVKHLGDSYDDMKILYFHAKGVSNIFTNHLSTQPNQEKIKNVKSWRHFLEYVVIERYEQCLDKLNEYDIVGPEFNNTMYCGNFWWANSHFIKKCPAVEYWSRWDYESWISRTINPYTDIKHYDWFHFKVCEYLTEYNPKLYRDDLGSVASEIIVHKATYGTSPFVIYDGFSYNYELNVTSDVTHIVKKYLKQFNNRRFYIFVDNNTMEIDPIFGHRKFLMVEFSFVNDLSTIYKIAQSENLFLNVSFEHLYEP